jgi:16S rRNA (guanine966-N2)-methyltransferase
VRVIAGEAKGVRLAQVPGGTRPMTDRAREGLFSSLGREVEDATVLDLFAGTGSIGIEALSRGAASAVFVDSSPRAVDAIRDNLRRTGMADRAEVIRRDVGHAVAVIAGPFDLVFLDPPYAIRSADLDGVLASIARTGLCPPGGLVVMGRSRQGYIPVIPVDWRPDRRLSYGDAVILAYRT